MMVHDTMINSLQQYGRSPANTTNGGLLNLIDMDLAGASWVLRSVGRNSKILASSHRLNHRLNHKKPQVSTGFHRCTSARAAGDIFSMGIVFFQLMVGQVPNGDVMGILQTSGKSEQDPGDPGVAGWERAEEPGVSIERPRGCPAAVSIRIMSPEGWFWVLIP